MQKNRPTKVARKERKKRQRKTAVASRVMTAHVQSLAELPARRLRLVRREQEEREQRIAARRRPAIPTRKPFLIGGEKK